MRFFSANDFNNMMHLSRELTNVIVDSSGIIYKIHQELTKTNSYGEATKKTWYQGVLVPMLVDRQNFQPKEQLETVDGIQNSLFHFLRPELELRNIYPEMGDIIEWDSQFYEIHNVIENSLWGQRTEYHYNITCETHLTRTTNLQLEKPVV